MEVEKRLDRDYFQFISLSHDYYSKITNDDTRSLCKKWLVKILDQKVNGIREKRNRNTFMMHLLTQMHSGELMGYFANPPEPGDLPSAKRIFDEGGGADEDDEVGAAEAVIGDVGEEFDERSGDARVYVAIRHLPDDQGMMGYISLTLDKKGGEDNYDINPCTVDNSKLRHARALRGMHSGSVFSCAQPSEREMEDFYLNNVEQKISGDVSQMFEDLEESSELQCWKTEDISFFEELLEQIDGEIRGEASEGHKLVRFLVTRLTDDLKKDPKMMHIMDMPIQQRHLRILEILRQKLVIRQQEKNQTISLIKMEERMARDFNCSCREDEQSKFMWQLAVTRPLKETEMARLEEHYSPPIISAFLELLSDDRQVILENGLRGQQSLLKSIRSEVCREVQVNKAAYNKAREAYREWNEILSTIEEMMYEAGEQAVEKRKESTTDDAESLLRDMIAQSRETERLIIEEARRAEDLTSKIADINSWTFSTEGNKCKDWSWEIKAEIEKLRSSITEYTSLIEGQTHRIEFLQTHLSSQ